MEHRDGSLRATDRVRPHTDADWEGTSHLPEGGERDRGEEDTSL